MPLRVAAISFLNPAPLLYNFEHEPVAEELRRRYDVHYTLPSRCAAQLHAGEADLGLIPIAELAPQFRIVPGCAIASQREVRSILLLVRTRGGEDRAAALRRLTSIAADTASRSSAAYVRVLLARFYGASPTLVEHPADPVTMLAGHRAALLIGDPALLARERRSEIDRAIETDSENPGDTLLWLDIAQLWREHTGLPWVAAVWAVRPASLGSDTATPGQLIDDLNRSREAGLAHREQLVTEWTPRLRLPASVIRTYLYENIYYHLDEPCQQAIQTFRREAAALGVLPPLSELLFLKG